MTARCTTRACPARFRTGEDRPCPEHTDDRAPTLSERMAMIGALLEQQPGGHDDDSV